MPKQGNGMKTIEQDLDLLEKKELQKKYNSLLKMYQKASKENTKLNNLISGIKKIESFKITASKTKGISEATAILMASDWHVDEIVDSEMVNGVNEYNESIAKKRAESFFINAVKLIKGQKTADIKHIILYLGGDFISGNIHDELKENTSMLPIEAMGFVQDLIASGIEYLLHNTGCDIRIVCSAGNHSRITKKIHISTESGNSLEYGMYKNLKKFFSKSKRINFIINKGYFTYADVYDFTLRFHHGHAVEYNGGVGGFTIPLNKAIKDWNTVTQADYDIMGHFHNFIDNNKAIVNGSLIGYNAYALRKHIPFDRPKQGFFLIDSKKGKTIVAPIFVE